MMNINKQEAITKGIEREIKMLEEQLKEEKESMIKQLDDIDTRFGIAKYAEHITVIKSKIEAYKQSLIIVKFVFEQE